MSKGKRTQPETPPQPGATRISPADVQEREFRLAFRGYNERDVDMFLDEITEELSRLLAENRRLREQLEGKGPVPVDPDHALLEADAIVLRAHEDAARILADAQRQASAAEGMDADRALVMDAEGPDHPAVPLVGTFIARERGFLQNMAALIQRHAEEVKLDIRRAKEAGLTEGLDRPADVATSTIVAPTAAEVGETREGEAADPGVAAQADDSEWVPEPAADGPADGSVDSAAHEEDEESPSWEAVAEAAWGASAASSWAPSEGPEPGGEVEPDDGAIEARAAAAVGAVAAEALPGPGVATELERPDLAPAGVLSGGRSVAVDDPPSLVHAAVRLGDPDAIDAESANEDEPRTLQELFWGES
jgi:DivIVA domain-containing protein